MAKAPKKQTSQIPVVKPPTQLTMEQRTKLLLTPCKTRAELKNWIKYHLSLDLPDQTVSRYADTNPLDSIWEIYDICVNGNNPQGVQELLYVASRGSGKTLGVAVAEFMVMLHDQRDVVHVGAILSQAKRCYEYQTSFMMNDKIRPVLEQKNADGIPILEKANMEKSVFNLVDRYSGELGKVTLETLPCTLKACLVKETQAFDNTGIIKPLYEFKKGDFIKSPQGYVEVVDNSIDYLECIRIELDDGRMIEGTLDHKVLTNKGWIELKDLTEEHEII